MWAENLTIVSRRQEDQKFEVFLRPCMCCRIQDSMVYMRPSFKINSKFLKGKIWSNGSAVKNTHCSTQGPSLSPIGHLTATRNSSARRKHVFGLLKSLHLRG